MNNLAFLYQQEGKVIQFPAPAPHIEIDKPVRTNSPYKTNGVPKAKPADPIRDINDVKRLLAYFKERNQTRNYMLFLLGFTLGIRGGDLLELQVKHVRDKYGVIRNNLEIYEDKTNKFNSLPLPEQVRRELATILTEEYDYDDYLFTSRQRDSSGIKCAMTIQQFNNIIKKAARDLEIPGHISSHSIRKTVVYHMLRENTHGREGELTIQYMLNHDDFSTTLHYCGLSKDMLMQMKADLVNKFF